MHFLTLGTNQAFSMSPMFRCPQNHAFSKSEKKTNHAFSKSNKKNTTFQKEKHNFSKSTKKNISFQKAKENKQTIPEIGTGCHHWNHCHHWNYPKDRSIFQSSDQNPSINNGAYLTLSTKRDKKIEELDMLSNPVIEVAQYM